jgi:hypothetical protein
MLERRHRDGASVRGFYEQALAQGPASVRDSASLDLAALLARSGDPEAVTSLIQDVVRL